MEDPRSFVDRLREGLLRIDQQPRQGGDAEATGPLRRSLERTIARLGRGDPPESEGFRYQFTGGKPLLLQGPVALPLEPVRLMRLLSAIQVELQPGESLDLDGALAASMIHPEVTLTDTQLRKTDTSLRGLKTGSDRDHGAVQSAESTKIRLRSRLTQLVSALQHAQKDSAGASTAALPAAPPEPVTEASAPGAPAVAAPAPSASEETLARALRKIFAAVKGLGQKAAAIGNLGQRAWVPGRPVKRIELLVSGLDSEREALLGAARGEGLEQAPGGGALRLTGSDGRGAAELDFLPAITPYLKQVLARAEPRLVLGIEVGAARCEDLILMGGASAAPADRDRIIELLRESAGHIDAEYLKKRAEADGILDLIKECWKRAKDPPPDPAGAGAPPVRRGGPV